MSKSQIYRHSTQFFFTQAIRVGSSQRLYQRAFAVIYMAGGSNNIASCSHLGA
jgi:hypothetical protein